MTVDTRPRTGRRGDLIAATAAFGLFLAAAITGAILYALGRPVQASAAPLFAHWLPHVGPGTPAALALAVAAWRFGPALADRLPWRRLLALGYATAVAWTLSLAMVDGWQRGIAGRLTTRPEYLTEVPGVTDVPAMLRGFTARIIDHQPDSWTTHVSGHPPGALLVFVTLDRLGLGGGAWAGLLCILAGAVVAVAVPATVRHLSTEEAARAAVPFAALFPGAIWIGVSADGLFAGVTALGVLLLTRRAGPLSLVGGALLAVGCYLSYGLVLMAPIALAVLAVNPARRRVLAWALPAALAVVAAFTVAGFDWLAGYRAVHVRYYQGLAAHRPYAYWVWANLGILAVSAGPAAAVILRRTLAERAWRLGLLPLAAAVAILAADLSGYSKAEVERIWLPFAVWFTAGAALLPRPDRRFWLAAQLVVALAVNHLLLTTW
jgi:methylthioxylose transferase